MKAAYGNVVNVKPLPSRGITRIEIEIPVESHIKATEMLFGRDVLVTLAPHALQGQPYGVLERSDEGDPVIQPGGITRTDRESVGWANYGPLAKSAILVCKEERFQRFVYERDEHSPDQPCEEHAARIVKERCGVTSRKEIDTKDGAREKFGALMGEYREWQA